jgi:O-antigen ligase
MTAAETFAKINFFLLVLLAFALPFNGVFVTLPVAIIVLNWLVSGIAARNLRFFPGSRLAWLFILFYLLHLAGLLYTSEAEAGLFDVQVKLSLALFPLVLFTMPSLSAMQMRAVLLGLALGCTVAGLTCLLRAYLNYLPAKETYHFYYTYLSWFMHPGYFSMYVSLAIVGLLWIVWKKPQGRKLQAFYIGWLIFLAVLVVLLASKTSIIFIGVLLIVVFVNMIFIRRRYLWGAIAVISLLAGVYLISIVAPTPFTRIRIGIESVFNPGADKGGAEVRVLIAKAAISVISGDPLIGVGTGDVKSNLLVKYEEMDIKDASSLKLNAHNQFLQTAVGLGIVGLAILLLCLLIPLVKSMKEGYWLYSGFLALVILNFLTESMLERQAGVIFYAFFNSFFASQKAMIRDGSIQPA